jgi:hypothetical protein
MTDNLQFKSKGILNDPFGGTMSIDNASMKSYSKSGGVFNDIDNRSVEMVSLRGEKDNMIKNHYIEEVDPRQGSFMKIKNE